MFFISQLAQSLDCQLGQNPDECTTLTISSQKTTLTTELMKGFNRQTKLTTITFSGDSEITTISKNALNSFPMVTKIVFEANNKITSLDNNFNGFPLLEEVDLTNVQAESISKCFNACPLLKKIKFSKSLKQLTDMHFPSLETIELEEGSTNMKLIDGVLYNSENVLVLYPTRMESVLTLPPEFSGFMDTAINEYSLIFEIIDKSQLTQYPENMPYLIRLKKFTIGSKITEIGAFAFSRYHQLKDVVFPEDSQLTTIGQSAFKATCLETINIPSTVESIGTEAFYDCRYLQTIDIPAGLHGIGSSVFCNCYSLKNATTPLLEEKMFFNCYKLNKIEITAQITSIPTECFMNCRTLKQISLPESVSVIGVRAFNGANLMNGIDLPESSALTDIKSSAFSNSKLNNFPFTRLLANVYDTFPYECIFLTQFTVHADNPLYTKTDDGLLSKDGSELIIFSKDTKEYSVPDSIKVIGYNAFIRVSLTSINLGNVVELRDFALSQQVITKLEIPNTVTTMGQFLAGSFIREVVFQEGTNLTTLSGVGQGATFLEKITIPKSVETISANCFQCATALTTVIFEEGSHLKVVEDSAFSMLDSLETITFPKSIEHLNPEAFIMTNNFRSINVEEGAPHHSSVDGVLFFEKELVFYPPYKFSKEYTVPDGTTYVSVKGNFYIEKLYIPDSVTEIQYIADCPKLVEIRAPSNCSIFMVSNCALLSNIIIPDDNAMTKFSAVGCPKIKSFHFGSKLTTNYEGFQQPELEKITCNDANTEHKCVDGILLDGSGATLQIFPALSTSKVPATVTSLSEGSFMYFAGETIELPSSITSIPDNCFYKSQIKTITLPDSVITISSNAFYMSALESITCNFVSSIGSSAFELTKLTTISLPEVLTLSSSVFKGTPLTTISSPKLTTIGSDCFTDSSLSSISCEHVTTIGAKAFSNTKLTTFTIEQSLTNLDSTAFEGCSISEFKEADGLTSDSVYHADGLSIYKDYSIVKYAQDYSIDEIISNENTTFSNCAFTGQKHVTKVNLMKSELLVLPDLRDLNLESIILPPTISLTYMPAPQFVWAHASNYVNKGLAIGYQDPVWKILFAVKGQTADRMDIDEGDAILPYAFDGVEASFASFDSVELLVEDAIKNSKIKEIEFTARLTSIEQYSFKDCDVEKVTFDHPLFITLDPHAFAQSQLVSIEPTNLVKTGYKDSKKLKNVNLRKLIGSVIPIGTFNGCESLESIEIPEFITSIDFSAFEGCLSLSQVKLPETITFSASVFRNTPKLKTINIHQKSVKMLMSQITPFLGSSIETIVLEGEGDAEVIDKAVVIGEILVTIPPASTGEYTIPQKVTTIKSMAGSQFSKVIIGQNVKTIHSLAMSQMTQLKEVVIYSDLESVTENAFENDNIETLVFYGISDKERILAPFRHMMSLKKVKCTEKSGITKEDFDADVVIEIISQSKSDKIWGLEKWAFALVIVSIVVAVAAAVIIVIYVIRKRSYYQKVTDMGFHSYVL